jgi:hypothetical protein
VTVLSLGLAGGIQQIRFATSIAAASRVVSGSSPRRRRRGRALSQIEVQLQGGPPRRLACRSSSAAGTPRRTTPSSTRRASSGSAIEASVPTPGCSTGRSRLLQLAASARGCRPAVPGSARDCRGDASSRSAHASGRSVGDVPARSGPLTGSRRSGQCVVSSFDRVCHQRLMARLAERASDRRLLVLIGRMLKARVMLPDGVVIDIEESAPQGSPLCPLLSNVVLGELDRELARRGHRFLRYADDADVYVRSERAGRRVMASLTTFIERRLRLKVNQAKSAVARPEDRDLVGFRLCSIRRRGPSRCCSRRAPSAAPGSRSGSSPRDSGEARLRAASPGSTCGWSGGMGSSRSPRPARNSRCARSTPTAGVGCARSCCATANADGRSQQLRRPGSQPAERRSNQPSRIP